jgi:hypothetical protein
VLAVAAEIQTMNLASTLLLIRPPVRHHQLRPVAQQSSHCKPLILTGTWEIITETISFNLKTQEATKSSFHYSKAMMVDELEGIDAFRCYQYKADALLLADSSKTDKYFYWGYYTVFELQPNGDLFTEYTDPSYEKEPIWQFKNKVRMVKSSNNFLTDSGSFILASPVAIQESTHVCVDQERNSIGRLVAATIRIPYKSDSLGLTLRFNAAPEVGVYSYAERSVDEPLPVTISFDYTNKSQLYFGGSIQTERNVTINLTEVSEDRILGSYSFKGIPYDVDGVVPPAIPFEGEFEIILR